MKKYVCSSCQLKYLDPLQIPILTLLKPFKVYKIEDFENKEDPKAPKMIGSPEISQYFNVDQNLLIELK